MVKSELPVACSLAPDALEARRRELLSDVWNAAEDRETIPEGIRLRFAATSAMLSAITQSVEAERHCCRFLRFSITVEPDNGPLILELTGPRGTGEFLAGLIERCLRVSRSSE